jgi:hypothetical protein
MYVYIMFHIFMLLYVVILFTLLTPGVLVSLPPRSSKLTTAFTHGLVFAAVFNFTYKLIRNTLYA